MDAIEILPCVIDNGNVRRPYPEELTQFDGAYPEERAQFYRVYQKNHGGLSLHVIDFYCLEDRSENTYKLVLWVEDDDMLPSYITLNSSGVVLSCGELQKNFRDMYTDKRFMLYESLPMTIQHAIRRECLLIAKTIAA